MEDFLKQLNIITKLVWYGSKKWTKELKNVWVVARYATIIWVLIGLVYLAFFRKEQPHIHYVDPSVNFSSGSDFANALGNPDAAENQINEKYQENANIGRQNDEIDRKNTQSLTEAVTFTLVWPGAFLGSVWGLFTLVCREETDTNDKTEDKE